MALHCRNDADAHALNDYDKVMTSSRSALFFVILCSCAAAFTQSPATNPARDDSLDEQVLALRAAGEPVTPDDLISWKQLPDDRNAAKIVHGLVKRMRQDTPEGGGWYHNLSKQRTKDYVIPLSAAEQDEIREALRPQSEVLAMLDRIRELDGFDWGQTLPSPLVVRRGDNPFPFGAFWGTGRQQLVLDGLVATSENDTPRAWKRVETLRRLAEGMSWYPGDEDLRPLWPTLHEHAAELACHIATSDGNDAGKVKRALLEHLAKYWSDDRPLLDAFIRHLRKERVAIIDSLQSLDSGKLTPKQMQLGGYNVSNYAQHRMGSPMWPAAIALHTSVIDAMKNSPALSNDDSGKRLRAVRDSFASGGFTQTFVLSNLNPMFMSFHDKLLQTRGRQKLAACTIAIRLYRMDNENRFPTSLNDLVPRYLPVIPTDPTANESALVRYRVDGERAMLWIAGRNGIDDGGTPRPPDVSEYKEAAVDEVVRL